MRKISIWFIAFLIAAMIDSLTPTMDWWPYVALGFASGAYTGFLNNNEES